MYASIKKSNLFLHACLFKVIFIQSVYSFIHKSKSMLCWVYHWKCDLILCYRCKYIMCISGTSGVLYGKEITRNKWKCHKIYHNKQPNKQQKNNHKDINQLFGTAVDSILCKKKQMCHWREKEKLSFGHVSVLHKSTCPTSLYLPKKSRLLRHLQGKVDCVLNTAESDVLYLWILKEVNLFTVSNTSKVSIYK